MTAARTKAALALLPPWLRPVRDGTWGDLVWISYRTAFVRWLAARSLRKHGFATLNYCGVIPVPDQVLWVAWPDRAPWLQEVA